MSFSGGINGIYDVYDWHSKVHREDKPQIRLQELGLGTPFEVRSDPSFSNPIAFSELIKQNNSSKARSRPKGLLRN